MITTELEFRKMTAQEFRNMELEDDDPYFYELINGILMKRNAPKPRHQRASRPPIRRAFLRTD
jgi:Uma2 family endonuclease